MAINCDKGRFFHFVISFYSDPDLTNLVLEVGSKDYWELFTINGVPMTSDGAYICLCECVNVQFTLPPTPPGGLEVLFNRQLYAKISKPIITFHVDKGFPAKAQILVLLDESGSMEKEWTWVPDMLRDLEAKLMARGVGRNDYGFVTFGSKFNNGDPRLWTFNTSGHPTPFGSVEDVASLVEGGTIFPKDAGGTEDGYEAIAKSLNTFYASALGGDAALNIILITDEDRDITTADTFSSIAGLISDKKGLLNAVVNTNLRAGDGQVAIGVTSTQDAIVADGTGGNYQFIPGGTSFGGDGNTQADYVQLAWSLGGIVWDLNILRNGGLAAQVFSNAFTSIKTEEIVQGFTCFVEDKEIPSFPFFCERAEVSPTVNIPLAGQREGCVHVRISFYADEGRESLVYSAFSLHDQRRFFVENELPCPVTPYGVRIEDGRPRTIMYSPEVLPPEMIENQATFKSGGFVKTDGVVAKNTFAQPDIFHTNTAYFGNGQSYPAGTYTVTYKSGAMKYAPDVPYAVNGPYPWKPQNYSLVYNDGGVVVPANVNNNGYATTEEVEASNAGLSLTFYHTGGKIGMSFGDSIYTDNSAIRSPLWELTSEGEGRKISSDEKPLLCGVKYYASVDLYYADTGDFVHLADYTYIFACQDTKSNLWRVNWDAKNWISSGQGKQDIRITHTVGQTLYPSISANWSGQFAMAWQDFRNADRSVAVLDYNPQIYYGFWDSKRDEIWTTGPGNYDARMFPTGFRPEVSLDPAGNFYFAAKKGATIMAYAGPVVGAPAATGTRLLTDDKFFNLDEIQNAPNQYLKARVYEYDQVGSFAVDQDKTVSVVEDCLCRLDVIGVPGTYAVRLRNENDENWSDWINIDNPRQDVSGGSDNTAQTEDGAISAYSIDENRFIVPWFLSAGTGMKRVAIQVLTFYGISRTFTMDILANISELEYEVSFYKTYATGAFSNPVPAYKGYPVVTSGTMYVKVEFKDKARLKFYLDKVAAFTKYAGLKSATNTLSFNVVQQGVNDQYNLILTPVTEGVYEGEWVVDKSDGVYNRDGLAALVVNVPNPCMRTQAFGACGTDDCDPYNKMNLSILRDFYAKYDKSFEDMTPESLAAAYRRSGLAKVTDITPLQQFYTVDDPRFMFGNPKFFINASKA
jgi:hypothetical protein